MCWESHQNVALQQKISCIAQKSAINFSHRMSIRSFPEITWSRAEMLSQPDMPRLSPPPSSFGGFCPRSHDLGHFFCHFQSRDFWLPRVSHFPVFGLCNGRRSGPHSERIPALQCADSDCRRAIHAAYPDLAKFLASTARFTPYGGTRSARSHAIFLLHVFLAQRPVCYINIG